MMAAGFDVLLQRKGLSIACEVAMTTALEHELGNIEKCLAADFDHVVVVSLRKKFLKQLETAISSRQGDTEMWFSSQKRGCVERQ